MATTAIIKTLPGRFARGHLDRFFGTAEKPCFTTYYFTLGRGRPSKTEPADPYLDCPAWSGIHQLYFSHRGILIGHFSVLCIVQNVGQLPLLTTLDGQPSEWQIKPDRWVAVCTPPFHRMEEQLFHEGFRGWRYFDLESHRGTVDAKIKI